MSSEGDIPRLVVAGTASGVGKTTVVLGLVGALRARGLRVATFKCGPDYLDPTYHERAAGRPSHNLDGWMMGREAVLATFRRAARGADIALIEGVMGLFDGASPSGNEGSTAEIAAWLAAPVLLVTDVSGMARSIAAVAHGFASFDPRVRLAGLVCNRIGSAGHLELLKRSLASPPIVGGLPDTPSLALRERHLGLHTADETVLPERVLRGWEERASTGIDLEALLAIARDVPALGGTAPAPVDAPAKRCRIGIAHDAAFHFYYEDNLRRLEELGAEIVRFSPLRDVRLPEVDGLYFGGGYPELHAAELGSNHELHVQIAAFARTMRPIYGECGGLMFLCRAIETLDGRRHPMAGLLPGVAVMCDRLQALGYVEIETQAPSVLGAAGLRFRGHQFRYSELREVPDGAERVYRVRRRRGGDTALEGYANGNVLASYVHAHWASNPRVAQGFVAACCAHARGSA
jgi:cobyrinic acid a,c-diamide synthase